MDFLMQHWFSIGAGIFLLSMILYGHYRGVIRLAVSLVALVVTLLAVRAATPYVTQYLKDNTPFYTMVQSGVQKLTERDEADTQITELPEEQIAFIEKLPFPQQMKEALIENNNQDAYRILGVDAFIQYVEDYLTNMIIQVVCFVVLFLVIYVLIRLVMHWLDIIAKLPILYGMNQLAGAVLGGIEGLLILWLIFLVIGIFAGTAWGSVLLAQIEQSVWLSFLYRNNLFGWMLLDLLRRLI